MELEIRQAGEGTDAYLDNTIVLQGKGSTLNSNGNLAPLPQNTYDIAIQEVELNSTRAKYNISFK